MTNNQVMANVKKPAADLTGQNNHEEPDSQRQLSKLLPVNKKPGADKKNQPVKQAANNVKKTEKEPVDTARKR